MGGCILIRRARDMEVEQSETIVDDLAHLCFQRLVDRVEAKDLLTKDGELRIHCKAAQWT